MPWLRRSVASLSPRRPWLDPGVSPCEFLMDKWYWDRFLSQYFGFLLSLSGTAVAQWLRCCATNRKVAGSIPDGVIGIFH